MTWQHSVGLGLVLAAGVGQLMQLQREERRNRKRNYRVPQDAVFDDFQWSQEDPFGMEELAGERLDVAERDLPRLAWL
jgi:hypothetical protein